MHSRLCSSVSFLLVSPHTGDAAMVTTFEPGQYIGKVTRWAMIRAKSEAKTPQFALTFLPLGRIDPQNAEGELLACPEVERTIFRPITENTADWLLRDL